VGILNAGWHGRVALLDHFGRRSWTASAEGSAQSS
jgi:hypothetical protein